MVASSAISGWIVKLQLVLSMYYCTSTICWQAACNQFTFVDGESFIWTVSNTSDSRGNIDASEPSPRIINGFEVPPMGFPYAAILNQGHVLKCGGVVRIDENDKV